MKISNSSVMKKLPLAVMLAGVLSVPAAYIHAASPSSTDGQTLKSNAKEGWQEGRVEGAILFNNNLSALDINVEVHSQTAILSGFVDSTTAKSLAEQVALGVDGITAVENKLVVDPKKAQRNDASENMGATISDAAITAKVKSKLLANTEVSGLKVNVDTKNKIVTLNGQVESDAKRDLVYYITRNTEGVRGINNKLAVHDKVAAVD